MKALEQIEKVIQQASLDGALTESAIQQYHEIIDRNAELEGLNKSQEKQLSSVRNDLGATNKLIQDLNSEVAAYAGREADVALREKEITKLEMKVACEAQRVLDFKGTLETIFKPAALRTELWKNIPGFDDQGYPSSQSANVSGTKTKHDE